jgi:uncharacterized protein YndB with AHSA1/START domain
MARYVDAIDLPVCIEDAFDYLADFSRTAEWDPGVAETQRLTRGKVRLGSRFRVVVSLLGRRIPFEYRITEFERPSRLVLSGGDSSLRSVDEITFVSRPGGTRVTYEARLQLAGIRQLADPILDLLFQLIGRRAVRGLRERLAGKGRKGIVRKAAAIAVKGSDRHYRVGAKGSRGTGRPPHGSERSFGRMRHETS